MHKIKRKHAYSEEEGSESSQPNGNSKSKGNSKCTIKKDTKEILSSVIFIYNTVFTHTL